ncbi:MAG: hypothetical protein NZO58_00275 [Gemmataceae bacterium]|nr:hypothetical protein [Gemmataceae bacterium]
MSLGIACSARKDFSEFPERGSALYAPHIIKAVAVQPKIKTKYQIVSADHADATTGEGAA